MLFHRGNTVVQMFCIALFCFVFLAHFTHVQATTTTAILNITLIKVSTASINNASGVVLATSNSTSVVPATSAIIISNTTVPVSSSTASPTARTTPKHAQKDTGRKFDGLSFFGGMILGAVICIVLLFSVKYYQAKKRSYHSL